MRVFVGKIDSLVMNKNLVDMISGVWSHFVGQMFVTFNKCDNFVCISFYCLVLVLLSLR